MNISIAYKDWKEAAAKNGIGRINYLLSLIAVQTLLMIALSLAGLIFDRKIEITIATLLIVGYAIAANYHLVSWRMKSIGHINHELIAGIIVLASAGLSFWSYTAAGNNEALLAMQIDAATLILGMPVGLYLIFMPSTEGKLNFLKKYHIMKEKRTLESERNSLLQEQEIERLKAEVEKLKA